MSRIREKVFVTVITNVVILAVVVCVFAISFNSKIVDVLNINSMEAIYKSDTQKKNVSLNINVYWGTEYIEDILQTLDRYNVKTTFFIGGSWANSNPEMLIKIRDKGHEIANHGFFHKDHKKLSLEGNVKEIQNAEKIIQSICGIKTKLFAPPSGSFNNTTLKASYELGYKTIMWSKDTIDWRDKDEHIAFKRATKDLKNGDFVLMHPTAHTAKALPKILQYICDNGFKAVTVSENLMLEQSQRNN